MISFFGAINLGFRRYFDFKGRSTRAEYWWWFAFIAIAAITLHFADMGLGTYSHEAGIGVLSGLFALATWIPGYAVMVRRLHDINKSGRWLLLGFIGWLIIPAIVLLVWVIRRGDNGTNKYGPAPALPVSNPVR